MAEIEATYYPDYGRTFAIGRIASRWLFGIYRHVNVLLVAVLAFSIAALPHEAIAEFLTPIVGQWLARVSLIIYGPAFYLGIYLLWLRPLGEHFVVRFSDSGLNHEQVRFSAGYDGMHWFQGDSRLSLSYSDVAQIIVGRDFVGFVLGTWVFYVPRKAFTSDEQFNSLVRMAYQRMTQGAKTRSRKQSIIRAIVDS